MPNRLINCGSKKNVRTHAARALISTPRFQAVAASSKSHDLQQVSGHGDVLEKMNELVEVGEIGVEAQSRCDAEQCETERHQTGLITDDEGNAAEDLSMTAVP